MSKINKVTPKKRRPSAKSQTDISDALKKLRSTSVWKRTYESFKPQKGSNAAKNGKRLSKEEFLKMVDKAAMIALKLQKEPGKKTGKNIISTWDSYYRENIRKEGN